MTLDEAIKHAEEKAKEQDKLCKRYDDASGYTRSHNKEIRTSSAKQCEKCADEHRQLAEWLKELRQLREQTRWIPVSERLPEVADCYAVTRQIGSDLIVDSCYFDGRNTWHHDNRTNHERNYLTNIIAWMPLPDPYKAERSEE